MVTGRSFTWKLAAREQGAKRVSIASFSTIKNWPPVALMVAWLLVIYLAVAVPGEQPLFELLSFLQADNDAINKKQKKRI